MAFDPDSVECREDCGEVDDAYFFAKTWMPGRLPWSLQLHNLEALSLDRDILQSLALQAYKVNSQLPSLYRGSDADSDDL